MHKAEPTKLQHLALAFAEKAAVFVENDRAAATVLQQNVATLKLPGATVHRCPAETYLAAVGADEPYDLVFADPPYAVTAAVVASLLATLASERWLSSDAVVVVERAWRDPEPQWPGEIKAMKQRRYGEGCLWYGRRA